MLSTLLAALAPVALFSWNDGLNRCNDGDRYTSGTAQPSPFHRRFCGWNAYVLGALSLASLLTLGMLMGTWQKALLLLTLPGAWFCVIHPTTTDGPCMLLAWLSSLLMPSHPFFAVLLSCVAGFIHERGPVFAAVYAMHPLPLVGLACVGWWRKARGADGDILVGLGLRDAIKAHKPYVDFLDWRVNLFSLRGLWLLVPYYGVSWRALLAVAVTFGSRIIGTDACRYAFWAAPVLVAELPSDVPAWMVALHVVFFRRAI